MDDTFGGEFNATQTATGGATAEQKAEGVAQVLIKQIMDVPEGHFQMFGTIFGMVNIVAIVRNIETSSTKVTYLLEDHTGQIEAHYWLEEGDTLKTPDVMLNNYVNLYGTVRSHGGQKTLMIFKLKPVLDPNEVCTHLLEVLYARYKTEELQGKDGSNGGGVGDFSVGGALKGTGFDMNSAGSSIGLEGKQLAVFQAIKSHASEEGISRRELKSKFKQISESELNSILDFMISEGHIYSSIDPDHFISTE